MASKVRTFRVASLALPDLHGPSMDEWDFSSSTSAWKSRVFLTDEEKQRIGKKFMSMHPARRIDEARLDSLFVEYLRFHELKVRLCCVLCWCCTGRTPGRGSAAEASFSLLTHVARPDQKA